MDEVYFVGVLDERCGDCLQLPHATRAAQVEDVHAVLEGVDLLLLRLLVPIEDAAREEERNAKPPCRIDGVDRLDGGLLPNGEHLARRVGLAGELHFGQARLCKEVRDQLLRRGVEKGVVDDRLLHEQHLILQCDLVGIRPAVVVAGDEAREHILQRAVIAKLDGGRVFLLE